MRKFMMVLLAAVLVGVAACGGTGGEAPVSDPAHSGEPAAWRDLEIALYNVGIAEAVVAGENWPFSPLRTVIEAFGDDTDQRDLRIEETKNFTEGATEAAFRVVRDRFLDDSVRGSWLEAELVRQDDGSWRVAGARMAWRCWRAADPEAWTAEPCP